MFDLRFLHKLARNADCESEIFQLQRENRIEY